MGMKAKHLTQADVQLIRDGAIQHFTKMPTRCRLPGMVRDLNDDEKRIIAFFEASVTHLNRVGVTSPEAVAAVVPQLFTVTQEVIEQEAASYSKA
jgi:hypothetical protein